jgi:tetratricopeptide (TPR) repeat protein
MMSLVMLLAVTVLGSTPAEVLALYHEGKTQQADQAVLDAAGALVVAQGPTPATVEALRQLGHLAEEQWRYPVALTICNQALPLAEVVSGHDSLPVADVLGDIARLQRIDGRLTPAEAAARRALELRTKLVGPDDPKIAPLLLIVAYAEFMRDRFDEAEKFARRALVLADLSKAPLEMASARSNLAAFLQWHHSMIEAERRYREAIDLYSKADAEKSAGMAVAAHNLVIVLAEKGRVTNELAELERVAAEASEASLGLHHPFTAETWDSLARIYRLLQRGGRSLEAAQRAQLSRGKAMKWCVNDDGRDGCLKHCAVASVTDAGFVELADGGKGSARDAGPVLVDVYSCPATFECLSLADAVSGVTPAQRTVCAPSCPTVGSSAGCPNGWSCNTLLRDGGAVGHGVCAPP